MSKYRLVLKDSYNTSLYNALISKFYEYFNKRHSENITYLTQEEIRLLEFGVAHLKDKIKELAGTCEKEILELSSKIETYKKEFDLEDPKDIELLNKLNNVLEKLNFICDHLESKDEYLLKKLNNRYLYVNTEFKKAVEDMNKLIVDNQGGK